MKDIREVASWYSERRPLYKALAVKVADVLEENIKEKRVAYHSVTHRGKSLESFTDKAKRDKYTDPVNEIKDMAGVRVITYLESDVSKIAKIVEELFDVDWSNSVDQSRLLSSDKLGYRSVHYVARFDEDRCKLPENEKYKDLPFEIQMRSLLQHSWAEFEHDRNYKFGGKLPAALERRLYLAAGMLEITDREFVALDGEIDKHKSEVIENLNRGDLDIEITTASLTEYLSKKFSRFVKVLPEERRYARGEATARRMIEELELFGISTLEQLDNIVPKGLEDDLLAVEVGFTFGSIIRYILMINDIEKYFSVSWRNSWHVTTESRVKLLDKYGVDRSCLENHVRIARKS